MKRSIVSVALVGALLPVSLLADGRSSATVTETATQPSEITLELIMSDPDWIGRAPESPYWSDDGQAVFYRQKREGSQLDDLYRQPLSASEASRVADEALGTVDVDGGHWSRDRQAKTYAYRGDIYYKKVATGEIRQLTRTAGPETNPSFLVGDRRIAFHRGTSIFVRDLDSGLEEEVAHLVLEDDPDEAEEEDDFLTRQQERLFDVIREEKEHEDEQSQRAAELAEADPTHPPRPFYLGTGQEILWSSLAPSGDWMAVVVAPEDRGMGRSDKMADWVTRDGYVEVHEVRSKVGTADGATHSLWLLDLATREKHVVDLSQLPGISDDPLAFLDEEKAEADEAEPAEAESAEADDEADDEAEAKPRAVRFEETSRWSPDGSFLAFQAHSYDNKDRWLAVVSRQDFTPRPVHRLQQEGWINWFFNELDWLPDSRHLFFLSEQSGYSHLYLHDLEAGETRRMTYGQMVVSSPQLSPDGEWIYYLANAEHPGIYEVFRVRVHRAQTQQLTRLGGRNAFRLSPDGSSLLLTHSTTTHPPELYVQEVDGEPRRLTHTVSDAFLALPWVAPEIVDVPSTHHDRPIVSRFYPPSSERGVQEAGRPAVVFVHGAGYLQNAHHGWSGYFREFMFHTLLSQHGYTVLDMDYRASAGYGAAWRSAIYRQMGTPELEDLKDGVAWLVESHGIDPDRVGVYGGSYGGFMTMMALFKAPDLFACGAALRPVTDWAHYNHPYTANILNTPSRDPEAYDRSSPIEFAEGLQKPLLICAPMQDDNVFFQDTVRLAQKLIELEKEDWEVAIYPVEPHGFRRPSSWLDEYRRIFKLFERHLQP